MMQKRKLSATFLLLAVPKIDKTKIGNRVQNFKNGIPFSDNNN